MAFRTKLPVKLFRDGIANRSFGIYCQASKIAPTGTVLRGTGNAKWLKRKAASQYQFPNTTKKTFVDNLAQLSLRVADRGDLCRIY